MSVYEPCSCAETLTYKAALNTILNMYYETDGKPDNDAVFEIAWRAVQLYSGCCAACYDAGRDGCSQDNADECEAFRMRHY